jgi:hypothetical protein
MAAGHNSRLQKAAFVSCEVLAVASRGCASIVRLAPVVAFCWVFPGLLGPLLKCKVVRQISADAHPASLSALSWAGSRPTLFQSLDCTPEKGTLA